ncbi:MAG: GntR family transcriptional regulator [Armatimonadota bacterium]|jgi:DNA-binding LacI/PurR family transcriptional regulator|nr:hypothetical protein [Armatimonadota bacterium]
MAVLTKTEQAMDILEEAIRRGKWQAGQRLPSERALMADLGISRTTLRHAMAALANENLIVARPGSGTYVVEGAVPTAIGILAVSMQLISPMGYWYHSLVEELQKKISDNGRRAMLFVASGSSQQEVLESTGISDKSVIKNLAGVIALQDIGPFKKLLDKNRINHVTMSGIAPELGPMVRQDLASMYTMARQIFESKGYTNYSVMIASRDDKSSAMYNYWCQLISDFVDGDSSRIISAPFTPDYRYSYDAFKEVWESGRRPRAIFFPDDAIFDVASRAIVELGIKVPEELAIITEASTVRRFNFPIEVTRLGWDPAQMADTAWRMLFNLVSGEDKAEDYISVPPIILEGNSI